MRPDAPSGVWLRTDQADYLYIERRTSPFHQAHIAVHAAAHLLMGEPALPVVDTRLMPDVRPELIRFMLGDFATEILSESDADLFAFEVLEGRRPTVSAWEARRLLRYLEPLGAAVRDAMPQTARVMPADEVRDSRRRLYQVVIAIRDAELVLRPHRPPHLMAAVAAAVQVAGLTGDVSAASSEALGLACALGARKAGQLSTTAEQPPGCMIDPAREHVLEPNLRSDAWWLAKVSQAFALSGLGSSAIPSYSSDAKKDDS